MSRCISSHGEYSAHELVGNRCDWCRVWQCPVCGQDEPYPLDGDDHDCITDDKAATVDAAYRESAICPECREGKHRNCDGSAWSNLIDAEVSCSCEHGTRKGLQQIEDTLAALEPEPRDLP